jgi:Transposase DDE domain group 1
MLRGILKVKGLPGQSTFWRFLASLNLNVAGQLLRLQRILRERVWAAANVGLRVDHPGHRHHRAHALRPADGCRKGYNPKNKGKKGYQPIVTFTAETHESIWGELRNGDRPEGQQIAPSAQCFRGIAPMHSDDLRARADSGFYCWEAVQAYEKAKAHFIIVARKTSRLLERLQTAEWKPSPKTDADEQCEFLYQPEGWGPGLPRPSDRRFAGSAAGLSGFL